MGQLADMITGPANTVLWLAQELCKDLPEDKFAYQPAEGVNHPAFLLGHMSIYAEEMLCHLGKSELMIDKGDLEAVCGYGKKCEPDASLYPSKDELVKRFIERHKVVIEVISGMSDEELSQPNPTEFLKDECPTLGSLVTFSILGHTTMHLGQLSTFRRLIGFGPVF